MRNDIFSEILWPPNIFNISLGPVQTRIVIRFCPVEYLGERYFMSIEEPAVGAEQCAMRKSRMNLQNVLGRVIHYDCKISSKDVDE